MTNLSNHPNIIHIEAKSAKQLEETISKINKAFTILSIYGMNNRHYAWLSFHTGVKKKILRTKTTLIESKKEKVKL